MILDLLVKSSLNIPKYFLLFALLFFVWAAWQYHNYADNQLQANRFNQKLTERYDGFLNWKSKVEINEQNPAELFHNHDLLATINKGNYGLFIYKDGNPVFWSDAITKPQLNQEKKSLVELNNGWFIRDYQKTGNYEIIWLLEISEAFSIKNQYLAPKFSHYRKLPKGVRISETEENNCYQVTLAPTINFYLDFSKARPEKSIQSAIFTIAYLLLIISLLVLFYQRWQLPKNKKKWVTGWAIIVIMILFRLIWLNNPFPKSLYLNPLFDPAVYAHSFLFPSLGDLLINALLILFFSHIVSHLLNNLKNDSKTRNGLGLWILLLVINLLLVLAINTLLEGLIKNSRIPFNIDHLFELGTFSLVGMLAIGIIFMSYFKLITAFVRMVFRTDLSFYIFTLLAFTVYGIYGAMQAGLSDFNLIDTFWTLPLILAIGSWIWYSEYVFYFGVTLLNLAVFSFFTAYVFEKYNVEKEHEIRQIIGERINQIQDPILELNFDDKIDHLKNNSWLQDVFLNREAKNIDVDALKNYFGEDWFRFKKRISFSDPEKKLLPGSPVIPELPIDSISKTASANLFFYYSKNIGLGYFFSLPILAKSDTLGYLSGVFSEIPAPKRMGFPKLLDNSDQTFIYTDEYLYARYRDNTRFYSNAEDEFPVDLNQLKWIEESQGFVNSNNLNIMVMPEKYGYRWMIAKPIPGLLQRLTIFSYLFLFLGFLYTLWLIFDRILTTPNPLKLSLRSKVQVILIGFIFGILTIYAIVIYAQITKQFYLKNNEQISERLNSINIELQHKTGHLNNLNNMNKTELKSYLDKFSEVFYSDISLFDNSGLLAGSSSALIWEKNLLSPRVNPIAFSAMELDRKSKFVQQESIGTFHYLSGYKPLYNNAGQQLGILNVPYFARQDHLKAEINRFLIILINVFVLLTGISVIVAIYVSNWITAPLKLLQTSFSSLDLISINKPIYYKGDDEVATMVNVYNQKVKELQSMAEQIAQSERESAWREMARQVAHEIKNPLTPMRLSIQHFQRLLTEDPEVAMEKSDKLVSSLIEQIDNLTQIANEFSQFAKISVSSRTAFDLKKQMIDLVNLFSADENISIKIDVKIAEAPIQADKGQIIRMFNNLIKNAIQAIGHSTNGEIVLRLFKEEDQENKTMYRIEIADNGKGIPEDLQAHIFNPNFTTKSTGMGLGLAITKKIVSNHKGSINFRTEQDKGTVFIVLLPLDS